MNRAHAVALILAAVTFAGCVKPFDPTFEPSWGGGTEVWLYVAPEQEFRDACRDGRLPPAVVDAAKNARPPVTLTRNRLEKADILIPESYAMSTSTDPLKPYSCVDGEFFEHDQHQGKHKETVVVLSQKKATHVKYRAIAPFKVLELKLVPPFRSAAKTAPSGRPDPVAPTFPFFTSILKLPTESGTLHRTGPIDASFNRVGLHGLTLRYKAVFEVSIGGTPIKIDPDIECRFAKIKI